MLPFSEFIKIAPAAWIGPVHNRDGTQLDFLHSNEGHHDFEMPRNGFIASNRDTLANLGLLKNTPG